MSRNPQVARGLRSTPTVIAGTPAVPVLLINCDSDSWKMIENFEDSFLAIPSVAIAFRILRSRCGSAHNLSVRSIRNH